MKWKELTTTKGLRAWIGKGISITVLQYKNFADGPKFYASVNLPLSFCKEQSQFDDKVIVNQCYLILLIPTSHRVCRTVASDLAVSIILRPKSIFHAFPQHHSKPTLSLPKGNPSTTVAPANAMDASNLKSSPFPPASDVPPHRNPPLAPSQEMAYRNKCIQLKRRLTEIENNNDATRKRISTERERLSKMRLLRAILLQQVKDVMESPGKRIEKQRLEELGITEDVKTSFKLKPNEGLLDDSSDESDEDEIPEVGPDSHNQGTSNSSTAWRKANKNTKN